MSGTSRPAAQSPVNYLRPLRLQCASAGGAAISPGGRSSNRRTGRRAATCARAAGGVRPCCCSGNTQSRGTRLYTRRLRRQLHRSLQRRSARCNRIVNGPPINLLGRVERWQAVSASEARRAGHPVRLAIGTEALRSESGGHTFESYRARHFGTEPGTPNRPALEAATSVRSSTLFDPWCGPDDGPDRPAREIVAFSSGDRYSARATYNNALFSYRCRAA
jgi:hypothetical protein